MLCDFGGANASHLTIWNLVGIHNHSVFVPFWTEVVSLAAGYYHTCALLSIGEVSCWGDNSYGQLGGPQHEWNNPMLPFDGGLQVFFVVARDVISHF